MSTRTLTDEPFAGCARTDHALWREILRERERAAAKHGAQSMERMPARHPSWLAVLAEEVGEAAHELTYDSTGSLRAELIQVAAVATAWIAAIDEAATSE